MKQSTVQSHLNEVVGRVAVVDRTISPNQTGKVRIAGVPWKAESREFFEKGEKVLILDRVGLTLQVGHLG